VQGGVGRSHLHLLAHLAHLSGLFGPCLALLDQLALVGELETSSRSSNGTSCGPYIFASSTRPWNCSSASAAVSGTTSRVISTSSSASALS
jgi:hypothetical protein